MSIKKDITNTLGIGLLCLATGGVGYIMGVEAESPRSVHLNKINDSGKYKATVFTKSHNYAGYSPYNADKTSDFHVKLESSLEKQSNF